MSRTRLRLTLSSAVLALAAALPAHWVLAEMRPTPNINGAPGLIDMPTGEAMPDGTFCLSVGNFGPVTRSTLSFQITPWLAASYRVQYIRNWNAAGFDTYDDRSFDLRLRLLEETDYLPALSLGLQDLAGTGLFSSEYIAATKTFGDRLKVTGCIREIGLVETALPRDIHGGRRFFGRAKTMLLDVCRPNESWQGIYDALDSYQFVRPGDVIMVENRVKERAYFGNLNAQLAMCAGAVGAVIDGVTRDRDDVDKLSFPVFERGYYCVDIKFEGTLRAMNTLSVSVIRTLIMEISFLLIVME